MCPTQDWYTSVGLFSWANFDTVVGSSRLITSSGSRVVCLYPFNLTWTSILPLRLSFSHLWELWRVRSRLLQAAYLLWRSSHHPKISFGTLGSFSQSIEKSTRFATTQSTIVTNTLFAEQSIRSNMRSCVTKYTTTLSIVARTQSSQQWTRWCGNNTSILIVGGRV